MTSTNYPIDLKLPKWWDVMGLKIDEIMGYNGLATKKLIIHKLLEVFCLSTLREFLTLFWEGKTTKIRLKNCLIVSFFQLYNSVRLFMKSILNNKFFGSLLSVNAQRVFDSFLGGKTTNIRLKICLIVSSFQLYKSVKLFMKSILNNNFFGSLLSVNAQRF